MLYKRTNALENDACDDVRNFYSSVSSCYEKIYYLLVCMYVYTYVEVNKTF
jgi:hypothetical protein